jgi:nitrogen fixation NifU-like protein
VTTYRAIVLEHFRRPKNRGRLENANAESEGANPLCGDRIRVQAEVCDGVVREARFTADACALCIASASMLTEHVRGMTVEAAGAVGQEAIHRMLEGTPPPARTRCVTLPVETLRRALGEFMER